MYTGVVNPERIEEQGCRGMNSETETDGQFVTAQVDATVET